jgi:serine/threonine protein phosphatase 1
MGDIHGAYQALMECLQRSGFDYREDTLIQLGDIADGGDRVYECVEELLKIRNLIAIKGNHDEWFSEFIRSGFHPQGWLSGGKETAVSYLRTIGKEDLITASGNGYYYTALNPGDIPETHQRFFRGQHLYYIDDDDNCFVHAGFHRHQAFKGQYAENYYWDRDLWTQAMSWEAHNKRQKQKGRFQMITPFREIFIGHTSTINWATDKPMQAANIHNIDTGAGHAGRLTIMDVATKQFWQSDPVPGNR